uniref:Macrophage stimulating 1 n=1 Tax=Oncorhynchus kisutch TaxID=8019 RepID=A0A8C7F0X5_ONCKI
VDCCVFLLDCVFLCLAIGYRCPLNDFQRSEGRELVPTSWNSARVLILPGLTLEDCARRCSNTLDCRAFNYETRPSITCKQLPWVEDGSNAEVKRNVNCDLYEKKVYVRKCIVGKGEDYRGKVFMTKSGHTCQQWWSKFPHDHRWTPTATNGLELNYCRNPDGDRIGPWCYTTDPERRYETCNIPHCKDEVCITCNGEDYRGQVDHTVSGRECQRWDQQYPHQHIYQPEKYPDKSLDDDYCRNPDASPVPWCYTTDADMERERCEISKCCMSFPLIHPPKPSLHLSLSLLPLVRAYSKWVISTKQCFSSCYVDLPGYSAMMGTLFRNPTVGEPDRQTIPLTKIVCGPSESQLVMLQLEYHAQFNERVSQICLPPERYIVPEGTLCEIAGWGETQGTSTDDSVLNVAQIPVLSNKDCNNYFRGRVRENEMCTNSFQGGVGACERDYGGPLACQNSDCWVLEGVIIPMRRCGHPGQPNIFIRVSVYVDWIKKVMEMA